MLLGSFSSKGFAMMISSCAVCRCIVVILVEEPQNRVKLRHCLEAEGEGACDVQLEELEAA